MAVFIGATFGLTLYADLGAAGPRLQTLSEVQTAGQLSGPGVEDARSGGW